MTARLRAWWRAASRSKRVLAIAALALLAFLAWEAITWPRVARLATADPRETAFMRRWERSERRDGREPKIQWTFVPRARIARSLQLAVLVAEDDQFFEHHGFAKDQVKDAIEKAWETGTAPRGASTITQQLAKNLWLSPSRNPLRKVKEALLTVQLERDLGKERILELYLNVAEMGPGIYGAEAASRAYFGKSASALTDDEAAELAASLSRPATWHPGVTRPGYRKRVALIRERMQRWPWVLER